MFVLERLEWSLVNQSPEQSKTEWLCVDVAGCKIIRLQTSTLTTYTYGHSDVPTPQPLCW